VRDTEAIEMIRAEVEPGRCEGFGFCEELAPEIFQVEDDGDVLILQDHVPEHLQAGAEAAVRACPVAAIRLGGDD
jgi:ferredoxin